MGKAYSKNKVCECVSPLSVRKRSSASGNLVRGRTTGVGTNSDHNHVVEQNSNGIVSRGHTSGSQSLDAEIAAKTKANMQSYNLRPKIKNNESNYSKTKVPSSSARCDDETAGPLKNRLLNKDDKQLFVSLGKLSLDICKNNGIEDEGKVQGSSSPEKTSLDEDLELPKHVLYYGWFFSTEISTVIHQVVMHYFRLCYAKVPQFKRFILTCSKDADMRDPFEYYKRPGKRVKPTDDLEYHITAKFLGRDPDPPYQTLVRPFIEKAFYIHLIGIVFTPRTLGVRVKLTPAQQLIFDEKDDSKAGRRPSTTEPPKSCSSTLNQIQKEIDGYNQAHKKHKKDHPNCKLKIDAMKGNNNIIFKRVRAPLSSKTGTSRAHITIGCAPNVQAKQTGDDLVDLIDLEQRPSSSSSCSNFQQDFELKGGVLRQFGKHADAFVLYSDTEMIVPGRFGFFI